MCPNCILIYFSIKITSHDLEAKVVHMLKLKNWGNAAQFLNIVVGHFFKQKLNTCHSNQCSISSSSQKKKIIKENLWTFLIVLTL